MKKLIITVMVAVLCAGAVFAQPKGSISSGASTGKVDAVLGKSVTGIVTSGGSSVTLGLPFSELKKEEKTVYTNEVVNIYGTSFTAPSEPGMASKYLAHVPGLKKYDLSLMLTVLPCNSTVQDADGNEYEEIAVSGSCWTKQNLRTTTYVGGGEVARDTLYTGADENVYGRLYTWYSAVNLPEDGSETVPPLVDGTVRGICPENWHIPTADEMDALATNTADDLNSDQHWIGPYAPFANALGFTAEPAGKYHNALSRFEGLTTETGFWNSEPPTISTVTTTTLMCLAYYCNVPFTTTVSLSDCYSVRCVKNK